MSWPWLGASIGLDNHSPTSRSSPSETLIASGALERLAATERGNVERLKGIDPPEYRLRVGDWRVRFCYKDVGTVELGISVVRVLHRREAYRKSALIRQDIPGDDGFDETADWEMSERSSN